MPPLTAGGRPLRVLVVDPSETSAETVERYLRAWGMVPTRVLDAPSALERYRAAAAAEPYDVAVLAPSGGGDDLHGLARELRAQAGEHALHVVALLDMGERIGEQGSSAPGDYDAVVGRPLKQARLHDALSGLQRDRAPASPTGHEDSAGDLAGLRILIAEDNPVNQQVLVRQAQRLGIEAEVVVNGQEVLTALERSTYDAVLMDCQMPVMDGYAATREIREREARDGRPRLPIVAVTANAMREDFDRCRDAGMDDFVAKPVALAALANAIERAVAANRADAPVAAAVISADAPAGGVDMAALSSLQDDLGGADALARIVRLFLEQLEPQAEQIDAAARNGEHETLARVAHRMRSSAATLGATVIADLLGALEIAAHDGDAAACDRLAAEFAASVATTRATFETVLSELDAVVSADG
jgi:CheY-like chemotaxis protein/HPt (histidine-containing phosphotransfer) domain-containing protein